MTKTELIDKVEAWLKENNLSISKKDIDRPWGAFWHISPDSLKDFLKLFFPNFKYKNQFISPKILLVEPKKRLSLQFHHKRSEEWFVIDGPVKVVKGENELVLQKNDSVTLDSQQKHRLCGLEKEALIAEIWIHDDPQNPSDEDDIVRLQDDFARK